MMLGKSWMLAFRDGNHTVEVKRKPWLGIGVINADGKMVGMFPAKAGLVSFLPRQNITLRSLVFLVC